MNPSRLVEPEDHAAAPGQVRKGAQRGGQRLRKAPSGRLDLDGRGVSSGSAEGGDEIVDVEHPGKVTDLAGKVIVNDRYL